MKIRPVVAWYDLWVGMYINVKQRRLYLLPVPCLGVCIEFGEKTLTAGVAAARRRAGQSTGRTPYA